LCRTCIPEVVGRKWAHTVSQHGYYTQRSAWTFKVVLITRTSLHIENAPPINPQPPTHLCYQQFAVMPSVAV
ncbi:hypothetical protein KIN20_006703, partial [Parelaphostrongylus tenuis]